MAIETATYINGLDATKPSATDPKSEGDDHLRLLKSTVKATFPNVTGEVTPTHTELNYVDGVTSAIQGQLDNKQGLNNNLTALSGLASNGLVAKTASGAVAARQIQAGTGLTVANGDGVAGNPTITFDYAGGFPNDASVVAYTPSGTGAVATTVQAKLRESVSVKDFGAVGDGVADDTAAIQAAINASTHVTARAGAVYRVTSMISIPSNRYLDFNNATFRRDFPNLYVFQNTNAGNNGAAIDENITLKNASFRDYGRTDASDFGAAVRFSFCKNFVIENIDVLFTSTQPSLLYGAWAFFISGENIRISGIRIDNKAQGAQADGVHCGYIKNFVMSDFSISSGDDSIALVTVPESYSYEGENKISENIVIGNGYCETPGYSALRIGAFNNGAAIADDKQVYKNVLFHDIVVGQVGSAVILLEDTRVDASLTEQHDNITFDNIQSVDQLGSFYLIAVFGDETSGTASTKSYKRLTFSNIFARAGGTSNNMLRINSCERVTFRNVTIEQNYGAAASAVACSFSYVDEVVYENCNFRTFTTNNAFQYTFTNTIRAFNTNFADVGNAFRGIEVRYNTSFPVSYWSIGGSITGYQRAFDVNNAAGATAKFADVVFSGTDIRGTVSDITSSANTDIAAASGLKIVNLLKRTVFSTGATGGSGSGGAGSQYISITVGGTTYKVLHDGTL